MRGSRQTVAGQPARLQHGFTLLEVMIALAIMGMTLVALSRSHQNSVRAANRAKLMSVAVMLARYTIVDLEDKLFEEGFSDFEEEEDGDFEEDGFERYHWRVKIDKVELPKSLDKSGVDDALGDSSGSGSGASGGLLGGGMLGGGSLGSSSGSGSGSPMASMSGALLGQQYEMIRNVLEQGIRRVSVSVEWKEGSRKKEVTVVGYFTDPRKIDMAASGALTAGAGAGSGSSAGSTGSTGSTGSSSSTGSTPNVSSGGTVNR